MNRDEFEDLMIRRAAELAGIAAEDMDPAANLDAIGIDSTSAVVLAASAEEILGREVDVGLFLRLPTIALAADELFGP